jgi:hypothetical protein
MENIVSSGIFWKEIKSLWRIWGTSYYLHVSYSYNMQNNFSLWKIHVEYLLVQNDQALDLKEIAHKPTSMTNDEWKKLDMKEVYTIQLFLAHIVLFNVSKENTMKDLWEKLKNLY